MDFFAISGARSLISFGNDAGPWQSMFDQMQVTVALFPVYDAWGNLFDGWQQQHSL
jgi:hypothetical protein